MHYEYESGRHDVIHTGVIYTSWTERRQQTTSGLSLSDTCLLLLRLGLLYAKGSTVLCPDEYPWQLSP